MPHVATLLRFASVAVFGLLLVSPVWSDTSADDKAKQIAEIEAKIKQLSSDLEKIKKNAEPAKPDEAGLPGSWVSAFNWRSIGPASMGGRITALAVFPGDPSLFWVATASGGLLKTENNGTTFVHQFDKENTVSIGDVAVAPSDKNIVWIGTGEANPRNSVSYGDGVYKSTDGGKTWKHMGLKDTFQTGKVVIHPKDPNIVYVAALGRLYGANAERGVFKTTDGGTTWKKVLFVDNDTGCIDMMMHPKEPDTLLAAMWQRQRDAFDSFAGNRPPDGVDGYDPAVKYGSSGGIFKTKDGGATWNKITKGLPTVKTGRIGLDWYAKDPNIVFAIIDTEKVGTGSGTPSPTPILGVLGEDGEGGAKLNGVTADGPAAKGGAKVGDIVTAIDGKKIEKYSALVEAIQAKGVGDVVKLSVKREEETKELSITLGKRVEPEGEDNPPPVPTPVLGVQGEDGDGGEKLKSVTASSPADAGGLKVGDVITAVEGKKVEKYSEMVAAIRTRKIGDVVKLSVKRGEETLELSVTLGKRPEPAADIPPPTTPYLGVQGEDGDGGAKLTSLTDGAPMAAAGAKANDVVTAIDGKKIEKYQDMVADIRTRKIGDAVKFSVKRGSESVELAVTLAKRPPELLARPFGAQLFGQRENAQKQQGADGFQTGGVYKSTDAGESWTRINSYNPRPMYFSVIRVDPSDDKKLYVLGIKMFASTDGGATFKNYGNRALHDDQHALWIDPKDGRHMIIGTDGGFYATYDRAEHWDHLALLALGQFYHVAVDNKKPYNVYGGLQDNGTWGGPSRTLRNSGPMNEDWMFIGGGDGFVCRVNPDDPDHVYGTSQDGNIYHRNLRTGQGGSARPRTQQGQPAPRFNWNTPYILSSHNSKIVYVGGDKVYRSLKQGAEAKPISPEITRSKRGTATALAESPRNADVLWVGTDDGSLRVTRDGGAKWTEVYDKLGAPPGRWVATIEASRAADGRAYVALDAHRSDDDKPYLFVTEDFGQTWKNITNNMPAFGSTRCLREDPVNTSLLLCGTEFAVFASVDRGGKWTKINNNLPTVAVHDFAIHPTSGEVVAATHGRSLWIADITALRQIKPEVVKAPAHLFAPAVATRYRLEPERQTQIGPGSKKFFGANPPSGVQIFYSLAKKPDSSLLKVVDIAGQTVATLSMKREPGLQKSTWDLSRASLQTAMNIAGGTDLPEEALRRPGGLLGQAVPAGTYRVVLTVNGKEYSQPLVVEAAAFPTTGARAGEGGDE